MAETPAMGRRERKKAATRQAISTAATELFLERGFDNVSIREIADKADVSPTTVFAHFPCKEALVFDEDDDQREQLVTAVRNRGAGTSISQALRSYFSSELANTAVEHDEQATRQFLAFVNATPVLADYAQRMWLRHEDALAAAVAAELSQDQPSLQVRAYARFVIQIQLLVLASPEPLSIPMLDAAFDLLDAGWNQYAAGG